MERIEVRLAHTSYPIYVGVGIADQFGQQLRAHYKGRQIAVITNERVWKLHGQILNDQFPKEARVLRLTVPDSEQAKTSEQLNDLYTRLLENHFERGSVIIAFGGGVVGDLAGFVAATYLRGVQLVQFPTTLLAQVDSSIGGKVGINHPLGKNLIGAFKQPLFVFSDVQILQTLPDAELRCGLGEVIKYGLSLNRPLFDYLQEYLAGALKKDPAVLEKLVVESARQKAQIVERDEKESNLRMVLNFGHTFGHALERAFAFGGIKHGEAVILGMKCALWFAREEKILNSTDFDLGMSLLNKMPIPVDLSKIDAPQLVEYMTLDKKVKHGQIRLVLIEKIGKHLFYQVKNTQLLERAFKFLKEVK